MTIESLRARLLSERAISRTARQRADELAKRVLELERQLKIVSLQRKKAEKATEDVLAILESNGISDASEAYDSNSQETSDCDCKVSNDTKRRKESSTKIDLRRNDMEAYSSSEIDSSSSTGRSLSWRSSKDSPNSLDRNKYKDSNRRRCSSFASNNSLPKRVGKSCRRIRRRDTRLAPEEIMNDDNADDAHDTTVATHSQDLPNSDIGPQTKRKDPEDCEVKDLTGAPLSGISGNGGSDANFCHIKEQVEDMERDLQDKAHVAKYEPEERAQRQWEEKFREDNSSQLDSCDPGNGSDVTEEIDDIKATEQACPADQKNCLSQEREQEIGKSFSAEKPEILSKFLAPSHADSGQTEDQKTSFGQEPLSSEFAFPVSEGTHGQVFSENHNSRASNGSFVRLPSNGSPGNPLTCSTLSGAKNGESSGKRKELSLMPQTSSGNLESVLDALQQAKLSLKHNLHSMPQLEVGSSGNGIESSIQAGKFGDRMEFPLGCPPGIFRLPTDFQFEVSANANYLSSDSALRLQNYHPESAHDKLISRPFMEARPRLSVGDPFSSSSSITSMEMNSGIRTYTPHFTERGFGMHTSAAPHTEIMPTVPFTEIRSGIPATKTAFESASDAGLSCSGRSMFLDSQMNARFPFLNKYTYPKYPFSPDSTPQLSSGERFPQNMQGLEYGMPSAARSSFYDNDHIRPTMYK